MNIDMDEETSNIKNEPTMIRLAGLQRQDSDCASIIEYLTTGSLPSDEKQARAIVRESQYSIIEHIVLWSVSTTNHSDKRGSIDRRLCVPSTMRDDILRANHESPIAGHLGVARTAHRINKRFYWPNLWNSGSEWIRGCRPCLKRKMPRVRTGEMKAIISSWPFEMVEIDVLGSLPMSINGNSKILCMIDTFNKFAIRPIAR